MFFWRAKNESWSRLWRSKAAPGYLEARRRARRVPPGGRGKTELRGLLAPPNNQKPKKLVAVGFRALGVAGVVFYEYVYVHIYIY